MNGGIQKLVVTKSRSMAKFRKAWYALTLEFDWHLEECVHAQNERCASCPQIRTHTDTSNKTQYLVSYPTFSSDGYRYRSVRQRSGCHSKSANWVVICSKLTQVSWLICLSYACQQFEYSPWIEKRLRPVVVTKYWKEMSEKNHY